MIWKRRPNFTASRRDHREGSMETQPSEAEGGLNIDLTAICAPGAQGLESVFLVCALVRYALAAQRPQKRPCAFLGREIFIIWSPPL